MLAENVVVMSIKGDVVLFDVGIKIFSSQNFCDFDKLVIVVFSLEERFLLENHASKHAS
jgi:hypothetical protein